MSYDQAFNFVVGSEGSELDLTHSDTGNWTGGIVGVGTLAGSKWGVSAASYPHVNISALTRDDAKAIYKRDYWDRISGDQLPPQLAYVVFDAAVNNGVVRAAGWLQNAVGAIVDCNIGPATLAKAHQASQIDSIIAFNAARTYFMGCLGSWSINKGWATRLATIPFNALQITE